mmetsp:Transcript_113594/g.222753  ORF Transcript_113594/g.222753 Transcript_113594/m.222753 type:complete len:221 (-) Transcript_113594:194-856(-)
MGGFVATPCCCTDVSTDGHTESVQLVTASPAVDEGFSASRLGGQFTMCVQHHPQDAGFNIDITDGVSLVIVDIKRTTVSPKGGGNPNLTLQPHDRIIQANGLSGDAAALMKELRSADTWELTVQRPTEFQAVVNRQGYDSLGLELQFAPNGTTLMIAGVSKGPIQDWNAKSKTHEIGKYDRIVEVNGTRGVSRDLLHAAKAEEVLRLSVLTYTSDLLEIA